MSQKVNPSLLYDYRYYVDAAVLQKIKELVNNDSNSLVYANLLTSVKVGDDQEQKNSYKTVEEAKKGILAQKTEENPNVKEATTINTSIDFKKALDVLRFEANESNPYYPKGDNATPEAIAEFKNQYKNARDIMTTHVGTDPHKITELPSRVVVAQREYLETSIIQARRAEVSAEKAKLTDIQGKTNTLKSQYETAKDELKNLRNLDPNTMTLDGQQEHTIKLNDAQKRVTELRTQIYQNLSDSKTARDNIKETEKTLNKTDKQFKKSLKTVEKRIPKEERLSFKERVTNLKDKITDKWEEYKTEKAFKEILGKEEAPAPQHAIVAPNQEQEAQPEENKMLKSEPEQTPAPAENSINRIEPIENTIAEGEKPVVLSAEETAAREEAKAAAQPAEATSSNEQQADQPQVLWSKFTEEAKTDLGAMVSEEARETVNSNSDLTDRFVNVMGLSQEEAEAAANAVAMERQKTQVATQEEAPSTPAEPTGAKEQ